MQKREPSPSLPTLTDTATSTAQSAHAPPGKTLTLKDATTPGLELRISARGKKWSLRYRVRHGDGWANRRAAIGDFPAVSVAAARKAAGRLKTDIARGIDPMQEKREKAAATAQHAARKTVAELFEHWAKVDLINRKDGGAEVRRMFTKDVLPLIGKIAVADVKKGNITQVTDTMLGRGVNRAAKIAFSLMRQMFRFAVDRDLIEHDPSASIRKAKIGGKEVERDRVLSNEEIRTLAQTIQQAHLIKTSETAVWIALSTCCRIGELLAAQWDHLDLDRRTWLIPAENSKNGKPHTITLSNFATHHFKQLQRLTSESTWCYPNTDNTGPVCPKTVTKQLGDRQRQPEQGTMSRRSAKAQTLLLAGGKWRPHDLRRTGATLMTALGVLPEVAERCLNHTEENKVKRTYQRHNYSAEMAAAWSVLGNKLEALTWPHMTRWQHGAGEVAHRNIGTWWVQQK